MIVLDAMLGRLSRYLRLLGYDLICVNSDLSDDIIIKEYGNYLILTRDRNLARKAPKGIYVISDNVTEQTKEVLPILPKPDHEKFSLCTICGNNLTEVVDRNKLPEYVPKDKDKIYYCEKCNKYYWYGSHLKNFEKSMGKIGIEI